MNTDYDKLTYRRCVGTIVFNDQGLVFVGQRAGHESEAHAWQMPQGGIDHGESPEKAAWRELAEETGIVSADLMAEASAWYNYDLPLDALGRWPGKYKGQTQRWFAFRFKGNEREINLEAHLPVEFSAWKWVPIEELANLVVPFKRSVYEAVAKEFSSLAVPYTS